MSAQPELTRAQVLSRISLLTEWNAEIRSHLENQSPLISDLVDIIMDYFEGMWSNEIMRVWNNAAVLINTGALSILLVDFTRVMQTPVERQREYDNMISWAYSRDLIPRVFASQEDVLATQRYPTDDDGPALFHDIIKVIELNTSIAPTLTDEISNYIISINHALRSTTGKKYTSHGPISFEAMNAIYIFICTVMWSGLSTSDQNEHGRPRMPVWDQDELRFVSYKRLDAYNRVTF